MNPFHSTSLFVSLTEQLLKDGYGVCFCAEGQSMHPTIRAGETVTVVPTTPGEIRRGDIILCRTKGRVIAHRVVCIKRRNGHGKDFVFEPDSDLIFVLRGDAACHHDEPVVPAQVLGKVVAVERDGRTIDLASMGGKFRSNAWAKAFRLKQRVTGVFD